MEQNQDQEQTQEKNYYTRETGKKEDHPLKLVNYCKDFIAKRSCPKGNNCSDRHISYNQLRRELKKVQKPYKKHLCKLYEKGGKCQTPKYYCLFAHGEDDVWGAKGSDYASENINDPKYDQKNPDFKENFGNQNQNQSRKNKRGGAMKVHKNQQDQQNNQNDEKSDKINSNKVQSFQFNVKTQQLEPILVERDAKNKKKNKNKQQNLLNKFASEMPDFKGVPKQVQVKTKDPKKHEKKQQQPQNKNQNQNLKQIQNQIKNQLQNQGKQQKPNKKGKSENQIKRNPKLKSGIVQIDANLFLEEHLGGGQPLKYDEQSISDEDIQDYEEFANMDTRHQQFLDENSGDFVTESEEDLDDNESDNDDDEDEDLVDEDFYDEDESEISLNDGDFEEYSEQFKNLRFDDGDDEDQQFNQSDEQYFNQIQGNQNACDKDKNYQNKQFNNKNQKKNKSNKNKKKQQKQSKGDYSRQVVGQEVGQVQQKAQIQEFKNQNQAKLSQLLESSQSSEQDYDFYNSSSSSDDENYNKNQQFSKKYPSKEKQKKYQKDQKKQKIHQQAQEQRSQNEPQLEQKVEVQLQQKTEVFKKTKLIKNKKQQNDIQQNQEVQNNANNNNKNLLTSQEDDLVKQIVGEKLKMQQKYEKDVKMAQKLEENKNDVILNQDQLKKLLKQNKLHKQRKNLQGINNQGLNLEEKISIYCFFFFSNQNDVQIEKYTDLLERQLRQNGYDWSQFELVSKKINYSPKINKEKLMQQQKCFFYQQVRVRRETGIKLLQLNMIKNAGYSMHFKIMPSPEIQIVFSSPIKMSQSINNLSFLSEKNEICYVYGSKLEQPESYHNEYKLYDLKKTLNSTKILENVVTAMLNNHVMYPEQNEEQGETIGQITLGVRDEDRVLEGIYCPKNVTETFFTILRKRFNDTLPSINQFVQKDSYRVVVPNHDNTLFYPILDCKVHVLSICRPQKQLNQLFQGKNGGFLERIEEGSWPISSFKLFQLFQNGYLSESQLEQGLKQYDNRYFYVISRKIDNSYRNNDHYDRKQDKFFEEHVVQPSCSSEEFDEDHDDQQFGNQIGGSEQSE